MKESDDVVLRGLPYVDTFRAFDRVVTMCFGVNLIPGYEAAIQRFKSSYLNLEISVTPKVKYVIEGAIYSFLKKWQLVTGINIL